MVSGTALFFGLFNNLAIFIILVAVYGALNSRFETSGVYRRQVAIGISFGLFAIGCMYVKIPVAAGVIVDQRNTIVALSGAFGGPLSALLCGVMTAAYRIYLGGGGVLSGVVGVALAAGAGIGLYKFRGRTDSVLKSAIGAMAATIIILPGFLLVGDISTGWALLKSMALPYGLAIFFGIFLVGLLLAHEKYRHTDAVELKKSEERFRKLFENLIDVSHRTDRDGKFIVISPSSKKMFGYTPEEVIGIKIVDFYKYPARRDDLMALLRKDGYVDNFEAEIRKKDGAFVWVSTNAKMLTDAMGKFIGVEGVTRDISRLKAAEEDKLRLEESLRQSQKMEALGTLAGGIAHDFNNILSAVMGNTELVIDCLPQGSRERENLKSVLSAADRAKGLTKQILMFSRKVKPDKKPVQIHLILEEVVNLLKQTIPATVKIDISLDSTTGFLLADPTQIHQIVLNLCINAYHSISQEPGEIYLGLVSVQADQTIIADYPGLRKGPYALLTVRDTGIGIDPKIMPRIFEPFFTTKEQGKGTGMGLSVVHGIVQDHGGVIHVESTLGSGTTFRVFLPLSQEGIGETSPTFSAPRYGNENIILVDDEAALSNLGKEVLEMLGYNVFSTTSAMEALETFRAAPGSFDLLITDQTMPEMTGNMLAEEVIRIRPDIPVIICTGHSEALDADKARAIGVRAFLMKPFGRSEMAETVRRVLDETTPSSVNTLESDP